MSLISRNPCRNLFLRLAKICINMLESFVLILAHPKWVLPTKPKFFPIISNQTAPRKLELAVPVLTKNPDFKNLIFGFGFIIFGLIMNFI